ncbi:hypothetical protein GCM10028787_31290 [Brachybacterium horti]
MMRQPYSRNRRRVWPLVLSACAVVALVAGIGVGVGLFLGKGSGASEEATATEPTTVKPTWAMTAEPVPNAEGSYGHNEPGDVARNFVIEANTWSPDEQLPDAWLSRIRPTVTDAMFKASLDAGMDAVRGDVADGVVGRKVNVTDVLNEIGDPTKLTVKYEVTDIMADGTEKAHDEPSVMAVRLEMQDVQLEEGSGTKTIQEYRVEDAWAGRTWGAEEK